MKSLPIIISWLLCSCITQAQIVSTVAGTGIAGYYGDNGPATDAKIMYPSFVVSDNQNNFFFVERLNNIVRKVSALGVMSTIAGNGTSGFSGDYTV